MKKYVILLFSLILSQFVLAQDTSERWNVEMSANIAQYNSLSISIEKEFTYGKFKFGPRVELVNLFESQSYKAEDTTFQMTSQIRLRLAQIEYTLNDKVRVGMAPFWMLGPVPRKGFYKTPTSLYAHIQLKEGLSLETSFTTSVNEMVQISFRKEL